MATPPSQSPDRLPPADSRSHVILKKNVEEKPASMDKLEEQSLKIENDKVATSTVSHGSTVFGPSRDMGGPLGETGGQSTNFSQGVYAPQTPPLFYGGYENSPTEWDEYHHFLSTDPVELGSPGIYNENPSLVFHPGYAYNPQMPYGPFSPVTTPVPSVRGDGPLYSPQQFPFSAPYYQQPGPPGVPYITSPLPVSHPELPVAGIDPQGFDVFGSGGPWSEWSKFSERPRSLTPGPSPVASPQPVPSLRSFSNNGAPSGTGMGNQQPRPFYRSPLNSFPRGYPRGGIFHDTAVSGFGVDGRFYVDKRRRGREIDSFCGCNVAVDVLNEQNKGPRASRSKNGELERSSPSEANSGESAQKIKNISYNQQDFLTEYEDAKFFIIKSYSEDNVHKSIKYGVWASTTSGNRRLDAAYQEAKEKEGSCPVFLLFSVNASAQFCGVAEMVGPVDFEKSVDYWQQDKWSGQFPVKWYLIKDVPNSQFRHIILENNDNKPVTNSRDTQEVKLEQGLEILKIFQNFESDVSILDDFEFYEDRQKMMQERKARQQANQSPVPANPGNEFRNSQPITAEFIKQMPLSFAQVVKLEDSSVLQNSTADKGGPANHSEDPNKRTSGPL